MQIAFIGLGNMGGPMAANLVKAGHRVHVFDLVAENMQQLAKLGAIAASSAAVAAQDAEVVITMLPAGKHVRGLYLGEHGLEQVLDEGTLVIDSSTIDAESARVVAQGLAKRRIDFVDAPVSGGVAGAAAGTLTFIVGGRPEQFMRAKPVLEAMGKNIFHAGDHGAGQVAKICNNMLLAVLMTGTSEALQLGMAHGLDPKVLSEIMLQSSGCNWTLQKYNPCPGVMDNVPSSKGYQGGFMVDLMRKDLGLAMDTAQQSHSATPMGALAQSLYAVHSQQGHGQQDFSSIFNLLGKTKRDK
ncbi:3-hydroxyisobutyrate dehydrogenase [Aliiglaciecola sp. CAU 1673]|uniref:3-hydroxyisobutyrate dehydrogenase n=1 Tax=Aliiglaciecola sp. CAU 1673 TaxID=3032595 RepID=UPI0023DA0DEF|nr:3-hydroxyisobutyrate dehydrogenase [Aliiglaciecola sp. CAU 1673]MDF2177697.1 3-hydroxyisobutyrate dehydrogenase [Aliiglaciecola sp. CAU 1673]